MPIPLHPSSLPPAPRTPAEPPRQRRSLFRKVSRGVGWMAAAPKDWVAARRISRGAALIRDLWSLLRRGPSRDSRFKTEADRSFDLRATAFCYGVSVEELTARFAARRRQSARLAYATCAMAWLFLLVWLWQALHAPLTATRIASLLYFLPFCVLFFLVAFYNALINFQIRVGRLAGWRDYLATSERFWPS